MLGVPFNGKLYHYRHSRTGMDAVDVRELLKPLHR
jgi:hypothetical protein